MSIWPKPIDAPEFDAGFLALLDELNQLVTGVGEPVEGNYIYSHHEKVLSEDSINHGMRKKRESLIAVTAGKQLMLEIGFNAGHSAAMVLYHNPSIIFHGVDICTHKYTEPAAQFLKTKFGQRFFFHPGNSLTVLPRLAVMQPHLRFDLMHIDGGHATHVFEADFFNCLRLAGDPAWIIVDDTTHFNGALAKSLSKLVEARLAVPDPHNGWNSDRSEIVRIIPQRNG